MGEPPHATVIRLTATAAVVRRRIAPSMSRSFCKTLATSVNHKVNAVLGIGCPEFHGDHHVRRPTDPYTLPRKRAGHRGDPPAGTPWGRPDSRGSARVSVENELVQNSVSRWGRHPFTVVLYPLQFTASHSSFVGSRQSPGRDPSVSLGVRDVTRLLSRWHPRRQFTSTSTIRIALKGAASTQRDHHLLRGTGTGAKGAC